MLLVFLLISVLSDSINARKYRYDEIEAMNIPLYKKDTPYCMRPLLSGKDITEDHIVVSSSHPRYGRKSRVRTAGSPWCSARNDHLGHWVQVDLGSLKMLAGLIVEGWRKGASVADFDEDWNAYVTHYSVEYSPDGREWMIIKDEQNLPRHFHTEREYKYDRQYYYKPKARFQSFDPLIHARLVRLNIHAWHGHPCLSLEVLGCDSQWALTNRQLYQKQQSMKIADCHYIQRIEVMDWQVTPSSARFYSKRSPNKEAGTWCRQLVAFAHETYLEIDLMRRQFISRMVVRLWHEDRAYFREEVDSRFIKLSEDGSKWTAFKMDMIGWNNERYSSSPRPARYVRVETESFKLKNCLSVIIFGCSDAIQSLGLWNPKGRLKLDWVTLSEKTDERHKVRFVKPGSDIWCPKKIYTAYSGYGHRNAKERQTNWLLVDMKKTYAITRIFTMAQTRSAGKSLHCTKHQTYQYVLLYSMDGDTWSIHRHYNHETRELRARVMHVRYISAKQCGAYVDIVPTIYARYFKFITVRGRDCISLDLFGNEAGKPLPFQGKRKQGCDAPLGMQSGRIRNNQLKASTFGTSRPNLRAHNARLNSNGAWCVGKMRHVHKYYAVNDSLVVDLLIERFIDGFATQGHYDRSVYHWVTGYLVHYSIDGLSWDVIGNGEAERYFSANQNNRDTVRHYLNPRIRARYLKFLPVAWHKWICMRIEIYGCDTEESLKEKLEKDLRDIEKERVDYVAVETGIQPPHPKRKETLNIYLKRKVIECGLRKYEPWGNFHLLKHILDFNQTKWVQTAHKQTFKASGNHRLFLTSFRINRTSTAKHFTCTGKMSDGTELYKHHVIAAKSGPTSPVDEYMNYASSLEIPQILVLQRVDPSYDGGKPIWTTPATVWATGTVASIGIFVYGIPFFVTREDRFTPQGREWFNFDFLGHVRHYVDCARLALSKGYDHFAQWVEDECHGSWYFPIGLTSEPKGGMVMGPWRTFYIKGSRKWERYQIKWFKRDEANNQWIPLFNYHVTDPDRRSSPLFSMKPEEDDDFDNHARFKGRFRAYDKVYYGDGFIGSHVLDIVDVTTDDLGAYKVEVYLPARKVGNEAIIELRHKDEPRISLPETFGACLKTPTEMNLTMIDKNIRDPNPWNIDWYHVMVRGTKRHRKLQSPRNSFTLMVANPLLQQTGEAFEADVRNRYGLARGMAKILVTKDVPRITWVTPSPHLAAQDLSDVLEVKTENDKTLVRVDWYHNGTLVAKDTEGFTFPGEKYESSSFRKKLKLVRLSLKFAGTYRVVAKGEYCQYEEKIEVKVILRPRLVVEPRAFLTRGVTGQQGTTMNVTVKGGLPKPQTEDMTWTKGGKPLAPALRGRVTLYTMLNKEEHWISVLTIKDLRESDSGDYTFTVRTGPANTTVTRSLLVLPADPDLASPHYVCKKEEVEKGDNTGSRKNGKTSMEPTKKTSRASQSYSCLSTFLHLTVLLEVMLVLVGLFQ